MKKTIIYVHVMILIDFPIAYEQYLSVLPIKMLIYSSVRTKGAVFTVNLMKISTYMGEHSCKLTEVSLK